MNIPPFKDAGRPGESLCEARGAIGVLFIDAHRCIGAADPAVASLLGYHHDDLVGAKLRDIIPTGDSLAAGNGDGAPCDEVIARHKDGSAVRLHLRLLAMLNGVGGSCFAAVVREVTEPERCIALHEHEQQLAFLMDSAPGTAWIFYLDGRAGFVSRDCCGHRATECAAGGIDGLAALHTEKSRRRLLKLFSYVVATGETVAGVELRAPAGESGGESVYRVSMAPIYGRSGAIVGVQGVHIDASELSATQQALKHSEARLTDILETAHDLVWSVDGSGCWTYLNRSARQIYGMAPGQLLGTRFSAAAAADHRARDAEVLAEVLGGRSVTGYETQHHHADGSVRHLSFNLRPRLDENWDVVGAMGTARDITEQMCYRRQLEYTAEHDVLTGLHNRHYFQNELDRAVARYRRNGSTVAVLYLDLDNFKYVNDTLGHAAGDRLLVDVSRQLQERVRDEDTLARIGGDEFTILAQNMNPESLAAFARELCTLVDHCTVNVAGTSCHVGTSIGAALIDEHITTAADLLTHADLACNVAKQRGRNQVHIYVPDDRVQVKIGTDVGWSSRITDALAQDRLALFFQPVVRITDGIVDHYEVLVRLRDAEGTIIAPRAFLPAAERFGIIHDLDRWVTTHAIERLAELRQAGQRSRFSINLSPLAPQSSELLQDIHRALRETRVDPAAVTFELKEFSVLSRIADNRDFISRIRELGCGCLLDDFGSGLSSFQYLKLLPVDIVKLDQALTRELLSDKVDIALVTSINDVAHALGKRTVAKAVEDAATLELLKGVGVDYAQGFFIGSPGVDIG